MAGHPDYRSYAQWRSDNLLAAFHTVWAQGHNLSGTQDMRSWKGAQVRFSPDANQTGYGFAILSWYSDAAKTHLLGSDSWGINGSTILDVLLPAKGAVCELDIDIQSVPNLAGSTQLVGVNLTDSHISYPVTSNYLSVLNTPLAATLTVSYTLPLIQGGLASVNFAPRDTTGELTFLVGVFNPDGTLKKQLHNYGQPTALLNDRVVLADDICGVQIINGDAVNPHSYDVRLSAGGTR